MIIAGPGLAKGSVVSNITSLLDVYPTLVAMTGGRPPAFLEGHSLFPLMLVPSVAGSAAATGSTTAQTTDAVVEPPYPADRFVVSQYHSNMGNTASFMVRWRRWKYIAFGHALPAFANSGYTAQLFDVEADPEELTDMAGSANAAPTIALLDGMLRRVVADPEQVDLECKQHQQALFEKYVMQDKVDPGNTTLLQLCKQAYTGCDSEDVAKIQAWRNQSAVLSWQA